MKKILFLLLASVNFLQAETPAQKTQELKGIWLISDLNDLNTQQKVEGFQSKDLQVPGGIKNLQSELGPLFFGKEIKQELIVELKRQLINYYKKAGRPFVLVEVPEQQVKNSTVKVVVQESKLDQVICRENCWFADPLIKKRFCLKSGEPVCCDTILNDISWINRNPFLSAETVFCPGSQPGTTTVELKVKDRCPLKVFGGADNSGNDFTGDVRFFAGITWGNAFWMGDILTYQFTTTDQLNKYQGHFGQYTMFLPWKHVLDIYGGYSKTTPHIDEFRSEGHYTQASVRYSIPLKPLYQPPFQEFTFGFDFKNTNNNLFFIGDDDIPIITNHAVNIGQFVAGYTFAYLNCRHEISFNIEALGSPGAMMDNQSNEDFEALRFRAKNVYIYGRLTFEDIIKLPKSFSFAGQFRGQLSSATLLPSEQFGLGGYDTIRGYEEREFNADDAICINLELRSPCESFWRRNRMYFLAFLDYGVGHNIHPLPQEHATQNLLSVGAGLRYYFNSNVSVRADYGFRLVDIQFSDGSIGMFHVGAFISF